MSDKISYLNETHAYFNKREFFRGYSEFSVKIIWQVHFSPNTVWTAEVSDFEPRKEKDFPLLHVAQTSSGADPASCLMCTWGSFPGG
jgi:hypothetical protein